MPKARVFLLTALAMIAFASNSLLCRVALKSTRIDPATFTTVRLACGALVLWIITRVRGTRGVGGHWLSACALFAYAAGFSFAYVSLPAATGALLLFGSVQVTMIGRGVWMGERLHSVQIAGIVLALAGLIVLLLPGLAAPSVEGSVLMIGAGVAWGIYSLRGKGGGDPTLATAGNFLRAVPMALVLSAAMFARRSFDPSGLLFAAISGAVTSGIGYVIWYTVLPALRATQAATVQLSVPVIASLGAVLFLHEQITLRLIVASIAILGGIALVIRRA